MRSKAKNVFSMMFNSPSRGPRHYPSSSNLNSQPSNASITSNPSLTLNAPSASPQPPKMNPRSSSSTVSTSSHIALERTSSPLSTLTPSLPVATRFSPPPVSPPPAQTPRITPERSTTAPPGRTQEQTLPRTESTKSTNLEAVGLSRQRSLSFGALSTGWENDLEGLLDGIRDGSRKMPPSPGKKRSMTATSIEWESSASRASRLELAPSLPNPIITSRSPREREKTLPASHGSSSSIGELASPRRASASQGSSPTLSYDPYSFRPGSTSAASIPPVPGSSLFSRAIPSSSVYPPLGSPRSFSDRSPSSTTATLQCPSNSTTPHAPSSYRSSKRTVSPRLDLPTPPPVVASGELIPTDHQFIHQSIRLVPSSPSVHDPSFRDSPNTGASMSDASPSASSTPPAFLRQDDDILGLGIANMEGTSSQGGDHVDEEVVPDQTDEEKGKDACRRILEGDQTFKWIAEERVAEFIGG